MNAMSAVAAAFVTLSLSCVPALAFTSPSQPVLSTVSPNLSNVDFVQGHEIISGIPAREFARSEASKDMAQRYFDVDVIVTLGALAIASGAFVAAGLAGSRRRSESSPRVTLRPDWREQVLHVVEADVMQFAAGLRQAA